MTTSDGRIAEAQNALKALNFDPQRYNERSALVLLGSSQLDSRNGMV